MNADQLFDLIGRTPESCLQSADIELIQPDTVRRPGKPMLIAAIVVLIVALAGCTALAVSLLNLESITMGEFQIPIVTEDVPIISFAGAAGSPEYEACREWEEFLSVYDPKFEILISLGDIDEIEFPEEYDSYLCYTQEMFDKINEIAEKYDLELMGQSNHSEVPAGKFELGDFTNEFLDLYNIGNYITVPDDIYSLQYVQYYYDNGTFKGGGDIQFPKDSSWDHPINYTYSCSVKGSFYSLSCNISDLVDEGYEEWTYKVPDGTVVSIVLGKERAFILADTDDYFVVIDFNPHYYSYYYDETYVMTRKDVKAFADLFNFTYEITPPQE